ncbi:MAG: cyclic nucleotide-binding domain-containing protein [Desulfofustis sp.]|nr:cyclic nucleotide-binding domain-containing protein [Desulfofustis sp.]
MKSFLNKISQLSSVQHLLLFDLEGELLYSFPSVSSSNVSLQTAGWQELIEDLGTPETADFAFENGRFCLFRLLIGTLLVGVSHDEHVRTIKEGCSTVRDKLKDEVIRRNVLIRMFTEHRRAIKPQYIKGLKSVAGPEVADILVPFLNTADQLPVDTRSSLISVTCEVLGLCRTKAALEAIKDYLHDSESINARDPVTTTAAQIAIAQLEMDNVAPPGDTRAIDLITVSPEKAEVETEKHGASPEDRKIHTLIDQNKKTEAISLIMDMIRDHAEKKDFAEAERYREMLLATDSMALREIISSAEIIEEEKSAAIDETLITTWDDLIQALSLEEFSALYHATRPRNSAAQEIIAEQGDFLSNLFFVNSGRIQLYTARNDRDTPFKTVEEGEIFGADSFFDISAWTYNARSLGANLSELTWKRLAELKVDYPTLQDNLLEYCNRFRTNPAYFDKPSTSRRKYERRKLSGRATMELLGMTGSETGQVARGDLLDISQGGVAFVLRFHRKEYALELLGKHVKVIIRPDNWLAPLQKNGMVKAVRCHDLISNDYSVHLEFDDLLGAAEVSQAAAKSDH